MNIVKSMRREPKLMRYVNVYLENGNRDVDQRWQLERATEQ